MGWSSDGYLLIYIVHLGDKDCMDWSDEMYYDSKQWCSLNPNEMLCDEHICHREDYSCGDGQCVFWDIRMAFQHIKSAKDDDCFNKRNLNYMCEVSSHRRAWTLESGLCWPDECNTLRRKQDDRRLTSPTRHGNFLRFSTSLRRCHFSTILFSAKSIHTGRMKVMMIIGILHGIKSIHQI
jgi:hypothetical protein